MIATISPAYCSFNESLSTLNFAKRAKNIKNRPVINEDIDHNGLIHQYESELKRIRKELEEKNKIIASTEELLKLKNREEKEKIDVIKAYEQTSRQLLIEREEKQKLEAKIELMNLQMIKGGEKIEETPQFKSALHEKQILLQKDFEQRILKIEKEKEEIEDSKSQVEAYNKLLYQQRDIMNSLSVTLNEKEEMINNLQKANLELSNKILELNNIIKLKNNFIEEMEKILDNNKIKHQKYSKMNIEIPITNIPSYKKTYIPYEVEQNGKEYIGRALPLLTSEEKIKELNDIVNYKNNEIILLKKVSEKFLETNNNMNDNEIKKKLNELQKENILLHHTINENNQMINLQRKENQSLEEHYNSIERIFKRTEKENLDLINIKEKIIGNLEQIIKKIDNGYYQIDNDKSQSIRSDLINIFQIILNNNINILKEEKKNGGGEDTNDNDITKIENNISINTNKLSSNNYPVKKLSSDTIKENKKYLKQNSLDDYDNYFKYHYNDRKIINNINNNNKSNQRNTNERNGNGVGLPHKNNINYMHDYKDSSGSDNFRTNRNKGENKINKKNPFEQPIINKDNNKRNVVTKNQKIKNPK
jgi:kinesin family protein 3/17